MRLNRLMQLLADNRRTFTPIESRIVRAEGASEVAVYLYDPIVADRWTAEWYGGVCPQDFVPAFRAIEAEKIRLYVNCGGGDVFALALPLAARMHLTHVDTVVEGADAFFPAFDADAWRLVGIEAHPADATHAFAFEFADYLRSA